MAVISTLLRWTAYQNPFLRTLVPSVALAYGIQAAVAAPSIAAQTERYFDLSGSLTYLSVTALSLWLPALRARYAPQTAVGAADKVAGALGQQGLGIADVLKGRDWRMVALSIGVGLWATRLGTFLFKRISDDEGRDSRFDDIRGSPPKFFGAFMAQATWVSLVLMPVLALNSLPLGTIPSGILLTDILGLSLFAGGFLTEVIADRQKSQWVAEKKAKKHNEDFLTRGLWSKSRHPNYFGEITLWTGVATVAGGVLGSASGVSGIGLLSGGAGMALGWGMAAVSPAFTAFLLTQVSGIPMSEKKYDKKYGDRKDYKAWKENTPVLIPKFW